MGSGARRYIGLDIHKEYFVAVGVNAERELIYGPRRVSNYQLDEWMQRQLTNEDAVVLEMTTNAYAFYDSLLPHVHSVTVVHPASVALVTRAQVKTDQKAAQALAELHAVGMLKGVWIPPQQVRDQRALIAQRDKMVRLSTIAKNRLHALLHRRHWVIGGNAFSPEQRGWWESLPLTETERALVSCDLDTLEFAERQAAELEKQIKQQSLQDERLPFLIQLPGVAWLTAMAILAAIGDISRFESAKKLVGYAGLGTRVHDSGKMHTSGRITKAGRKDLRQAMVNAANHAVKYHPHWKEEMARLEPRLGRSKAIVAIARKLLVAVWHVLTKKEADRFAVPQDVARSFLAHTYKIGVKNLPAGKSGLHFTREQLDQVGIGQELKEIPWGSKQQKLPPSQLLLKKE